MLGGVVLIGAAAHLAAMLDRGFLDEAGWDPRTRVLSLPAEHRLLGRKVCRVEGCQNTVHSGPGVSSVLHPPDPAGHEHGRDRRRREPARRARVPEAVRGVGMPVRADGAARGVVRAARQDVPPAATTGVDGAVPGRPASAALAADARMLGGGVHSAGRWRGRLLQHPLPALAGSAGRRPRGGSPVASPGIGRGRARAGEPARAAGAGGRGGVVRRSAARRGRGEDHRCMLRALCDGLRRRQAASITTDRAEITRNKSVRSLRSALTQHVAAGSGRPRQRTGQGHLGSRRLRPSRVAVVHRNQPALAGPVRQTVGGRTTPASPRPRRRASPRQDQRAAAAVGVPRPQTRSGLVPRRWAAATSRTSSTGWPTWSPPARSADTGATDLPRPAEVLAGIRSLGLTRPGQPAAGLAGDFAIERGDIPAEPERGEPGRDLPPEIMAVLCANLDTLEPVEVRVATQIGIDTGRRPEDILALPWTAWTATRTAPPCSSTTTPKPTGSGGACRSARPPPP